MPDQYQVHCQCGAVSLTLSGEPRVRGYCHCEDCRELLQVPYHSVTAWLPGQVHIQDPGSALVEFQHPAKRMKRVFCRHCGETLYNTNAMDWRVVSQFLLRENYNGSLPVELAPLKHFFYGRRIVDIEDNLPKRD